MKVELELWHLVSLFVSFMGCCWLFGTQLLRQFEKRLDERFDAQEQHRQERDKTQDRHRLERDAAHDAQRREDAELQAERHAEHAQGIRTLERDLLMFKAQLPDSYVRRDDYIRGQTVIEAKLDALASGQSELRTLVAAHD